MFLDDFVKLPHFCFDDTAQDIFVEWCTELYTVHNAHVEQAMAGMTAKLGIAMARLEGIKANMRTSNF